MAYSQTTTIKSHKPPSYESLAIYNVYVMQKKNPLLIPYITAGFPSKKLFLPVLRVLSRSRANFIEVGVPHSDPLADGKVIQQASQIALKNGVSLHWIIKQLQGKKIGKKLKPLILFSYLNPILSYGFEKLLRDLPKPLFYGVIIPDLPLEEASKYIKLFKKYNLNLILLVAPTTSKQRLKSITKLSSGFIYLVSVTGVTGVRKKLPFELKRKIKELRSFTKKPIVVGFGISNKSQASQIISYGANGVVIGSAIIKLLSNHVVYNKRRLEKLKKFLIRFKL